MLISFIPFYIKDRKKRIVYELNFSVCKIIITKIFLTFKFSEAWKRKVRILLEKMLKTVFGILIHSSFCRRLPYTVMDLRGPTEQGNTQMSV